MDPHTGTQQRSIDELLGPAGGRFFGSGYRRVQHELLTEPYQDDAACAALTARVVYPPDWSLGPEGGARRPHLSTIDAVVLPLMALSRSTPTCLWARHAHVRRVELRAGPEPWFQLSAVPLHLRRSALIPVDTLHRSELVHAESGNIRTTIAIERGQTRTDDVVSQVDIADDVYGALYRTTSASSVLLEHDPEERRIVARHSFSSCAPASAGGVEGVFWPSLTVVDYLVAMGQLAQALIHLRHGNSRAGGLWMRRVTIEIPSTPEPLPADLTSTMTVRRDQGVELDSIRYRNIAVEARTSTDVRVVAHLAKEELP